MNLLLLYRVTNKVLRDVGITIKQAQPTGTQCFGLPRFCLVLEIDSLTKTWHDGTTGA